MKTVKNINIYTMLCAMFVAVLSATTMTSCSNVDELPMPETGTRKGYLTVDFNISGAPQTRIDMAGESANNEESIMEIDLFFYKNTDGNETAAFYHYHQDVDEGNEVEISFDAFKDKLKSGDSYESFKIVAVVNCGEDFKDISNLPTIAELKEHITKVEDNGAENSNHRAFRGVGAPQAFVMTNLTQEGGNTGLVINEDEGTQATISLKRVAAKIRVALAIDESVTDDEGTWVPNTENMRLYFSNGMGKARLDGDFALLDPVDDGYFSISTTGSKVGEESDYSYARPINSHDSNNLTGTEDKTYTFYNDVPHYTYPTSWTESMTETHQPMLTIVIPWKKKGDNTTTYQPTYYSVPVNKKGNIVSNAYYYLRTHIGMKGSSTPEVPMEVDVESEILNWGQAEDSEVELKPIRYLILNQTDFTINNETSITVPFSSTHQCSITDCKIWYYGYNVLDSFGEETVVVIDDNTTRNNVKAKGLLYDYSIDNTNNTFTFTHQLFDGWFYLPETDGTVANRRNFFNNSVEDNANREFNEQVTDSRGRTYIRKKIIYPDNKKAYSKFEVEITIRHTDKISDVTTPYEETIIMTFYPSIYISSNQIDESGGLNPHDGWILVNGYGTSDDDTGRLKRVTGTQGNRGDQRALLTFTVTSLSEDDKDEWDWVIDDPRSLYINNELSNTSMDATQDNQTRWSNEYGGPYDGTFNSGATIDNRGRCSTNRHANGSGLQTIWENYEGPKPWTIQWSNGTWDVQQDYWSDIEGTSQYHRTLTYYYPTIEAKEKGNIIAPKYTIVSYHAYAVHGTSGGGKEVARRRCAAYQQWGYPAGRWRLPTHAEIQFIKKLQRNGTILDVFGTLDNWSAQGRVDRYGDLGNDTGTAYTRCVYDDWYWEQVDANGTSYNRIPDPDGSHANWKKFHWGDRPKENPLNSNSADAPTVENFLKKMNARK